MSDAEAEAPDLLRAGLLDAISRDISIVASHLAAGDDLWIRVSRDSWVDTFRYLRDKQGCRWLDFVSAIDWLPSPFGRSMDAVVAGGLPPAMVTAQSTIARSPNTVIETGVAGGDTRFQMFGRVYNIEAHFGVTVKCDLPDGDLSIPTLIPVFPGVNWHEREVWEMFGITVTGHPDLRHLYLPGDFEGHPLRKDFPLVARMVKPWPGVVDVEQMPGETEEEGEASE